MGSLRTKLVLIMVLLILALMAVTGSFLINGVGNFYIDQFYDQMDRTFSTDFISQLQRVAGNDDAAVRLKELLMAQSDLGIDISGRNVYVLDSSARVLESSDGESAVEITTNLLAAINGEVGQSASITTNFMDLALPISQEGSGIIVYILDNKATVDALTTNVFDIIFQSLALGLGICLVLSILLAQILLTPIRALSVGTKQVASGNFTDEVVVTSHDEIGDLTESFNHMSQVLRKTLWEAENERNKLTTLFLHMTDGVVAFGSDGKVIHYNPAATAMLHRKLDTDCNFQEIFGEEADFTFVQALKSPQFVEGEKTVKSAELELFFAPFSPDNAQGGVLAVIHDVTEQRKNEQTRREFVANVSHELRTPLTNVKSYAETIVSAGDELPQEMRDNFLSVIIGEADRMTRIVQDLLTLSKFDYGKMEMTISRFLPFDAIDHVAKAVTMDAQNHGHTVTVDMTENLPEVNGDRQRIEQVLMNVVSNAIKYTADGGKIHISAGVKGSYIWIDVADNGIGIPEKDLPQLFERFYRVDKARSRESGGTGLGLSIAKEILNQHKGDITVQSTYGEGSTVTITLPTA
ncbi:MAG: ATP-binding protein [Eubacteriales bacterium]